MREFASIQGLRRLFSFTAMLVVSCVMLVLSGCGHKCHCNRCHNNSSCSTCNTSCSTCSTCGVAENTAPACTTCQSCQTGTQYNGVGNAPPTLSEPAVIQQQQPGSFQGGQPMSAPAYSTTSNYSTNVSVDRTGASQDLPIFSPMTSPSAPAPAASITSARLVPPAQPAGALVPQDTPSQGGGTQYHTLQQGETVYALARKYNVKPKAILEANHFSDPNHLSVGTKVMIPAN